MQINNWFIRDRFELEEEVTIKGIWYDANYSYLECSLMNLHNMNSLYSNSLQTEKYEIMFTNDNNNMVIYRSDCLFELLQMVEDYVRDN